MQKIWTLLVLCLHGTLIFGADPKTCPDGVPGGMIDCSKDEDLCMTYELGCHDVKEGGKYCCGDKKDDAADEDDKKTCPDGVKGGMVECGDDEDICKTYELGCHDVKEGGKYCCGPKKSPDDDDEPEKKPEDGGDDEKDTGEKPKPKTCPDGVPGGMIDCGDDKDKCSTYKLQCLPVSEGGKYCCGGGDKKDDEDDDEPETNPDDHHHELDPADANLECPKDGIKVVRPCDLEEECTKFKLTCTSVGDKGHRFCCKHKSDDDSSEPEKTPDEDTGEKPKPKTCPDGVPGGMIDCGDDKDKCSTYKLQCLPVSEGGKYCCGGGDKKDDDEDEPETNPDDHVHELDPEDANLTCPKDDVKVVRPCDREEECTKYKLTCTTVGDEGHRFCCKHKADGDTSEPDKDKDEPAKNLPQAKTCPDGVKAGMINCGDDPDKCSTYKLNCLPVSEGGKYCCGGGKKPDTEDEKEPKTLDPEDEGLKCPDGEGVMAPCDTPKDCTGFKLVCTLVEPFKDKKKFCCAKTANSKPVDEDEPETEPKTSEEQPEEEQPDTQPDKSVEVPDKEGDGDNDSGDCKDVAKDCVQKDYLCKHSMYDTLVDQYCRKTCKRCKGSSSSSPQREQDAEESPRSSSSSCKDSLPNNECQKKSGLCKARGYESMMEESCKKTCKLC